MSKIIYITGGQRSGKSSFAQKMAENLSETPVYLATAKCWDDEFRKRIERHQSDRGEHWTNIEEQIYISEIGITGRVILMDCVTLWATNIFTENDFDTEKSLALAKAEWDRFIKSDNTIIVVSNEIGLGVIPAEASVRRFVDLQGWINQYIAKSADQVYFMVSGIPQKIK